MNNREKCELIGGKFTEEGCLIPKYKFDDMGVEEEYILHGFTVVTHWYGNKGFNKFIILTNKEGYEEIKKDPLQDFISFGVASVDYAEFDVQKNIKLTKVELLPKIRKGKKDLSKEEEEFIKELTPEIVRW